MEENVFLEYFSSQQTCGRLVSCSIINCMSVSSQTSVLIFLPHVSCPFLRMFDILEFPRLDLKFLSKEVVSHLINLFLSTGFPPCVFSSHQLKL